MRGVVHMTKTSGSTERDTYILQQKLLSVTSDIYKSVCNLEYNYEMKSHGAMVLMSVVNIMDLI